MKKRQDAYTEKRIKEVKTTWKRLQLGNYAGFVTIIDHKDNIGRKNPEIEDNNIWRYERNYLRNIKDAIRESRMITNNFDKKYKQDIIDDPEITGLVEDLLEVGEWSNHTKVDNYKLGSELFYITLKFLISKAPIPIQNELTKSIQRFVELNNLPLELGYEKSGRLRKPEFFPQRDGTIKMTL